MTATRSIQLTRALLQQFTPAELRLARREIKSFLVFQATHDEFAAMIRCYLAVHT